MPNPAGDPRNEEVDAEVTSRTLQEFEALVADLSQPKYVFRLYVAGNTTRSSQAITNVRRICEQYLPGQYELDVIDVYQQPEATKSAEVIALPTLIKEFPFPPRRFVGDMSNTERIVVGLKLRS
jgi:circadian clock protein KaiB